ncbi:alpha-amylase family glycosyl hydrolase [Candidatus Latescibacterota bacterium]
MKKSIIFGIIAMLLFSCGSYANSWLEDAVFYEIFVRSYYDSDSDGVGDFKGIEMKLDYIKELGANALWLMPINTSETYHGYDIEDYYDVNEDFGTMDDFKSLLEESEKKGIKIVMDLVINHSSNENEWFKKSAKRIAPYDDWYIWRKELPDKNWGEKDSREYRRKARLWNYNETRQEYYFRYFSSTMPDLNYSESVGLREEIHKIAKFWLDMGVDGFRLDAIEHLFENAEFEDDDPATTAWLIDFNSYVKSVNPEAIMVGEVYPDHEVISKYYGAGDCLDICFDIPFGYSIIEVFENNDVKEFETQIMDKYSYPAPLPFYASFLTNHDQNRIMHRLNNDMEKAKMAAVLLATAPGTLFMYYGEEIGMHQAVSQEHHRSVRTPMHWDNSEITSGFTTAEKPWKPLDNNKNPYNAAFQQNHPGTLLKLYQQVMNLRKSYPAMRKGDYSFFDTGDKVIAYDRIFGDEKLLVLMNISDPEQTITNSRLFGEYKNILNGETVSIQNGFVLRDEEYYVLKGLSPFSSQ